MAHRLLQANINHCRCAQDLLVQSMAEWLIEVAVVAEPYFVSPINNWVGDLDGLVAIASARALCVPPLITIKRGKGYVALEALIGPIQPRRVLVVGDLNAKSTAWGSPKTDARGEVLEDWAATTGFLVLNKGSNVLERVETLSDHLYIRFDVSPSPEHPDRRRPRKPERRWVLGSLNKDVLVEAAIVQAWQAPPEPVEVEGEAEWFRDAMSNVCDACMTRAKPCPPKRRVYWWSHEIEEIRSDCVVARRQYTRHRRLRRRNKTL
ncbi:uncharacterized protein [Epargyreus clarus]|uniref:uncharacterized protein n=1 Tax=Epargyreus clarus TaxID=520877 RepID=UPI003C2C31A4